MHTDTHIINTHTCKHTTAHMHLYTQKCIRARVLDTHTQCGLTGKAVWDHSVWYSVRSEEWWSLEFPSRAAGTGGTADTRQDRRTCMRNSVHLTTNGQVQFVIHAVARSHHWRELTWKPTVSLCSLWALFPERTLPFGTLAWEWVPPVGSCWKSSATSSDWGREDRRLLRNGCAPRRSW